MCEPRAFHRVRSCAWIGLVAAMALGAPMRSEAQTSAELAVRIVTLQDSIKVIHDLIRAERVRESLSLDDSVVSDGVVVLFPSAVLTERDREALRAGIAGAKASIEAKYGKEATRLLDGEVTSINFPSRTSGGYDVATFADGRQRAGFTGRVLQMPLRADAVERYLLGRAGQRLMLRDRALQAFAGAAFSLTPEERDFYVARQQLAVSNSSVARRCGEGSLSACRTLLDIRHPELRFAKDDSVPRNNQPIPQGVHASVVVVAMEIGGANVLQKIGQTTPGSDEPVAILAEVAGIAPDSLLRAWSARLNASGGHNVNPSLPFAAAVFGWCGVFLLAATRRRPR